MVKQIDVVGPFDAALENKFNKDIKGLKKGDAIVANITSPGGSVEVLKRMTAKVIDLKQKGISFATFVPEYANSAGFFLFLLGDYRDIEETATVHYHPPRVELFGDTYTKNDLTGIMADLTAYQEFTNQIFKASCDISPTLFSLIENSELPMNRAHLQSLGIIN